MFLCAFLVLILLLLQRQDFAYRPGFLNSAAIQETIVPDLNQMTPVTGPRIGKSPPIKFLYPFASPLSSALLINPFFAQLHSMFLGLLFLFRTSRPRLFEPG